LNLTKESFKRSGFGAFLGVWNLELGIYMRHLRYLVHPAETAAVGAGSEWFFFVTGFFQQVADMQGGHGFLDAAGLGFLRRRIGGRYDARAVAHGAGD